MQKMVILDLPDNIYNWIANHFEQRGHLTKIYDMISAFAFINASIIQGSVIGPPSYVVVPSDLHAKSPRNSLMKYADDSYLLVGSSNICSVNEEFAHIKAWAAENNLQLNPHKTRELVVYRRRAGSSAPLDPFYRVLPGLPQCGFLVLSCLPTLQWAIAWMRFFPLARLPSKRCAC